MSLETAFTAFAFPATGAPTPRTMPARLAEVFNVKDYGAAASSALLSSRYGSLAAAQAVYPFVTTLSDSIDWAAIQAAINAALAVQQPSGNTNGAKVELPFGEYTITRSLTANNPGWESSITLSGGGQTATTILGTFVGYLINKPDDGGVTIKAIENIAFINYSTSAFSGGIRLDRASNVTLNRIQVQARNGLHIGGADSGFITLTSISNASPAVFGLNSHNQRVGQAVSLYNDRVIFTVTAANATAGAVYQAANGQNYTVDSTIASGATLNTTGVAAPASGTLTKQSGTGDSTITFSSRRTGLPSPLLDGYSGTRYYIVNSGITTNAFEVSATVDGTPVNTTTANYGTSQLLPRNNVFCVQVFGSVISCNAASGTAGYYGAFVGQVEFYGCTFVGWDVALIHSNIGLVVQGSRFETNNTAIRLGDNIQYGAGSTASHSSTIFTNSFERDNIDIDALNCSAFGALFNSFTGDVSVDGLGTVTTGLLMGTVGSAVIAGNTFGMSASNACVDLQGCDGNNIVFLGNNAGINAGPGTAWKMPLHGTSPAKTLYEVKYIGNNNTTAAFPFAALPPSPVEGMRFSVTDGAKSGGGTAAPGDAVQGSGSQHIPVYRTNSAWIYA